MPGCGLACWCSLYVALTVMLLPPLARSSNGGGKQRGPPVPQIPAETGSPPASVPNPYITKKSKGKGKASHSSSTAGRPPGTRNEPRAAKPGPNQRTKQAKAAKKGTPPISTFFNDAGAARGKGVGTKGSGLGSAGAQPTRWDSESGSAGAGTAGASPSSAGKIRSKRRKDEEGEQRGEGEQGGEDVGRGAGEARRKQSGGGSSKKTNKTAGRFVRSSRAQKAYITLVKEKVEATIYIICDT